MSTSVKSWVVKTNELGMAVLYIFAAWNYNIRHGLKLNRSGMKGNGIEVLKYNIVDETKQYRVRQILNDLTFK